MLQVKFYNASIITDTFRFVILTLPFKSIMVKSGCGTSKTHLHNR